MNLFALVSAEDVLPIIAFVGIVAGVFWLLSTISRRNSQAEDRLERIGRPKSLVEIEMSQLESKKRFSGIKDMFSSLGGSMVPDSQARRSEVSNSARTSGKCRHKSASIPGYCEPSPGNRNARPPWAPSGCSQ